jgi:hypothetical protein
MFTVVSRVRIHWDPTHSSVIQIGDGENGHDGAIFYDQMAADAALNSSLHYVLWFADTEYGGWTEVETTGWSDDPYEDFPDDVGGNPKFDRQIHGRSIATDLSVDSILRPGIRVEIEESHKVKE